MRSHKHILAVLTMCASLFGAGCSVTHAHVDWLASPVEMQTDPYGGWVYVQSDQSGTGKTSLAGELIAVGRDSLYLADEAFHAVAFSDISLARLVAYDSHAEEMSGLVTIGTVASLSNGLWCIVTGPMWILGGGIATSRRSFDPVIDYPASELRNFAPYARYPQGLPLAVDRTRISMKPYAR